MMHRYIFDIFDDFRFCDAINVKGVKLGFRYLGNSMGRTNTQKDVLKLDLKISL